MAGVPDPRLPDEENARVWAEEAQRRDQAWDANPKAGRPAADVFRNARTRLEQTPRRTCYPES